MNLNLDLKRKQKVKRCKVCQNVLVNDRERKQCKCRVCLADYAKKYHEKYFKRGMKKGNRNLTFEGEIIRPFPFKLIDRAVKNSEHLANGDFFFFDKFMEVGK